MIIYECIIDGTRKHFATSIFILPNQLANDHFEKMMESFGINQFLFHFYRSDDCSDFERPKTPPLDVGDLYLLGFYSDAIALVPLLIYFV